LSLRHKRFLRAAIQLHDWRKAGNLVQRVVAEVLAICKAPEEIYSPVTLCLIGLAGLFGRGIREGRMAGQWRGTSGRIRRPIQFGAIML